jgi:hypothetical protein
MIHATMDTARQGKVKGLQQMNDFRELMTAAGRPGFMHAATNQAAATMEPKSLKFVHDAAVAQAVERGELPAGTTTATATAQQMEAAIGSINFERLSTEGGGPGASAVRTFVDRTLGRVEADPGLNLMSSTGTRTSQVRGADTTSFIDA